MRASTAVLLLGGLIALGAVLWAGGLLGPEGGDAGGLPGQERAAAEPGAPVLLGAERPDGTGDLPGAPRAPEAGAGAGAAPGAPAGADLLEGQVLDEQGQPLGGVRVLALGAGEPPPVAVTDADGRYALRARGAVALRLEREGGPALEVGAVGGRVALPRAFTLAGVVLDALTQAPVAGLPVTARRADAPSDPPGEAAAGWTTRSAEDGTFTLDLGAGGGGRWLLEAGSVWREGGGEHVPVVLGPVEAGARGLEVRVARGLALEGQVLDATGAMLALPLVATAIGRSPSGDPDHTRRRRVLLPDGRLRVPGLAPGRYDLQVAVAPAARGAPGAVPGTTTVPNLEAGSTGLVVRLVPSRRAEGRLVDDQGAEVRGPGVVRAFVEGRSAGTLPVEGVVPGDGTFQLEGLEDGLRYEVLGARFGARGDGRLLGVRAGDGDLVLVLPRGGRIAGRVLDAQGRPAPRGVPVGAVGRGPDPGTEGWRRFGATAEDGRFEITGLGEHRFDVEAGGGLSAYLGEVLGDVAPDGPEVTLRVAAGVELEGRLVDSVGEPASAESLSADDGARRAAMRPYVQVGADGRFRLQGLRPGPVVLWVRRGGVQVRVGEVAAPGRGVVVALPPG